jgi:NAD(P)H dehydrogenase (quinone)
VTVLADPAPHISKSYALTGPELKDMYAFAGDYAAALGRRVVYVPEDVETWNEAYIDDAVLQKALGDPAAGRHVAEHLRTQTRLIAGGRYDVVTDELESLLGHPPRTMRWALQNNTRLRELSLASDDRAL